MKPSQTTNYIYEMLSDDEKMMYKLKGEEQWFKELRQELALREMKRQYIMAKSWTITGEL